jgi:hypothetical protein
MTDSELLLITARVELQLFLAKPIRRRQTFGRTGWTTRTHGIFIFIHIDRAQWSFSFFGYNNHGNTNFIDSGSVGIQNKILWIHTDNNKNSVIIHWLVHVCGP